MYNRKIKSKSGNKRIKSGNKRIKSGNKRIKSGNKRIKSGNKRIKSGNKRIKSGNKRIKLVAKVIKRKSIQKLKKENIVIRKNRKVGDIFIQNDECLSHATILILWRVGSICEKTGEHGISHFIEHMLFKGTTNRPTSRDVTNAIYNLGGNINAYTSREMTGYYVTLPNDKIEIGLELLSDMLHNSLLRKKDMEDEKKVVIQENKKYNSNPISYLMQNLHQTIYKGTPMAYDVGGFNNDIRHFRYAQVLRYLKKNYCRGNRLVCISGNLGRSSATIERLVEKYFGSSRISGGSKKVSKRRKQIKTKKILIKRGKNVAIRKKIDKFGGLSQAYIALAFPAYSQDDDRNYCLNVIGNILAGNMSSRLFMRLREKHGLVYSVHFNTSTNRDSGYIYITAGTNNEIAKIQKVIEEIYKELRDICDGGITEEEIEKTKQYMIESMKMEDNSGIIFGYGEEYLLLNKYTTRAEICQKYARITKADIDRIVADIFRWQRQYLVVLTDKKCVFLKDNRKEF